MSKYGSKQNYVKLITLLIVTVFLTLIVANLYKNIVNNKINAGVFENYSIKYNELNSARLEFSGNTFLYISYTGNENIFNLDTKLKKVLKEYGLNDYFFYLNMRGDIDEVSQDYLINTREVNKLNNALELTDKKIVALPAILYYQDDKLISIIDSSKGLIDSGKFVQLLENYEIINN